MSKYRVKSVDYDEDDLDEDEEEDYDADPEEQEYLEECTNEVLKQLRSGNPSITTVTRNEVQESLWHYYNDVDKSVRYLRSEFYYFIQALRKKKKKKFAGKRKKGKGKSDRFFLEISFIS